MLIAYKGFESDMTCRGFQYKLGETFELSGRIKLCKRGFHACILPIDVIRYYPCGGSIYAKVELTDCDGPEDIFDFTIDTKICGRKIHISEHCMSINDLICETFNLLDRLAVFVDLGGMSPSDSYYHTVDALIEQDLRYYVDTIDKRINAAMRLAHHIFAAIVAKLIESNQICDNEDLTELVSKLQQMKDIDAINKFKESFTLVWKE